MIRKIFLVLCYFLWYMFVLCGQKFITYSCYGISESWYLFIPRMFPTARKSDSKKWIHQKAQKLGSKFGKYPNLKEMFWGNLRTALKNQLYSSSTAFFWHQSDKCFRSDQGLEVVERVSRGGNRCHCWKSRGSWNFRVGWLILMLGPSGTHRSSLLSRVTLNQAIHHFGKGRDSCT